MFGCYVQHGVIECHSVFLSTCRTYAYIGLSNIYSVVLVKSFSFIVSLMILALVLVVVILLNSFSYRFSYVYIVCVVLVIVLVKNMKIFQF